MKRGEKRGRGREGVGKWRKEGRGGKRREGKRKGGVGLTVY